MKKLLPVLLLSLATSFTFAAGHVAGSTHTNVTCNGLSNGTAHGTVTGGVGPFGYAWAGPSSYAASTQNISSLAAGSYTLTVTDSSDLSTANTTVVITQPTPLAVVISGGTTICSGVCTTISAMATGGTPGYAYNWVPATGLSSTSISSPTACPTTTCTYTVTVTDMNGCTASNIVTILVNPSPIVTLTPMPAFCGACNGSISVSGTGGVSYSWTGPGGYVGTVMNPAGLCPGTYTVSVTSAGGCVTTQTTNVVFMPAPTATVTSITNASCGMCDGAATVTPSGGAAPYTYLWNTTPSTTTATAGTLCAGTYNVLVTDANGCVVNTPVTINSSGGVSSAFINTVGSACTSNTGEIHITAITGGTAPYTVSINGGPYTAAVDYTGLAVGGYTVQIKDAGGCIYNATTAIGYLNAPVITLDSLNGISCSAGTDGSIYISVSGGTPGYTINWSNGASTEDLPVITTYGNYTVTVSDAGGCTSTQTYYVNSLVSLYGYVTTTMVNCGVAGGAAVTPYGGVAPYSFMWNTGETTPSISTVVAGVHNCTITDAHGCSTIVYANVPGGGCMNTIKGRIYNDLNNNCVQDSGEPGLSGKPVIATPGGTYAYTDINGDYTLLTPNMSTNVSVSPYYIPYMTPTCLPGGSLNVNISMPGDTSLNNNIGYYSDPAYFNIGIHPGWSAGNPGFPKHYWIYPYNYSPTAQNMVVKMVYDSNLVYTGSSMGGVHNASTHSISWTFTGVAPGGLTWSLRPTADFMVPASMSITSNLNTYFEVTPIVGDADPSDNTLSISEPVTGARDPNSKSVIPKGLGTQGNIETNDSVLLYTIHFQNNGNDTCHFVVVSDTLSSYVDPATIQPGASSHPYTFDLSGEGVMTFRFDNIMLPDSTTDEPASNGYVNYRVHLRPGLPVGTEIRNTAYIYFDFNEAVITPTTLNTIYSPVSTSIDEHQLNTSVAVFPNPFSDKTTFVIRDAKNGEVYGFELMDVLGKTVRKISGISEHSFEISRTGLENGVYFYRVIGPTGLVNTGKLIVK